MAVAADCGHLRWSDRGLGDKWRHFGNRRELPGSIPRNALGVIEPFNLQVVATWKLTQLPSSSRLTLPSKILPLETGGGPEVSRNTA